MAKKKSTEELDDDIVMVGDGAETPEDDEDDRPVDKEDDDSGEEEEEEEKPRKKAKKKDEDPGDSDEDDERVGHGEEEEDEESDEKKPRERESRKDRRERQRQAKRRNELELNFLRQRNESLEKRLNNVEQRTVQNEANSIDQRINSVRSQMKVADQVLAKAHDSGDGVDIVEAQAIRDKLREQETKLTSYKNEMNRKAQEQESDPEVDSRLVYHAQQWMATNDWYDPQGGDRDSRKATAIDARLTREGYDPRTPAYWNEFTRRCKKELPHVYNSRRDADDDDDDGDEDERPEPKKRQSGPRFSTGGRERQLRKNEVYVSSERKQALKDLGVWDDPKLRNRYLKNYQKWDKENPSSRSR